MDDKSRPKYSISVVAQMFDVHPQTLRLYEREGLMKPQRTQRNTRMYSDSEIERLKGILNLTQEMGVNLAGVEVILSMRDQIGEMHDQMTQLRTNVEELLRRLHEKIQREFTERDFAEIEGLVPVKQRQVVPFERDDKLSEEGG